jgi:hypothetical protein
MCSATLSNSKIVKMASRLQLYVSFEHCRYPGPEQCSLARVFRSHCVCLLDTKFSETTVDKHRFYFIF